MRKLTFRGKLVCPVCKSEISDEQYLLELFHRMEEQSRKQREPQMRDFVDVFKCGDLCPRCSNAVIWIIKWTKFGNFVKVKHLAELPLV